MHRARMPHYCDAKLFLPKRTEHESHTLYRSYTLATVTVCTGTGIVKDNIIIKPARKNE